MVKIKLLFLCLLIFFFFISKISLAQESEITPLVIITETPEIKKTVDYDLPYPGLLPDSSLYVLKTLRDKIISFIISSPLKKAEFSLLQADKRLNASVYLFNAAGKNEEKIKLAISTISKAENYFHEAISEIKKVNGQEISARSLTEKLLNASKKHQEVISLLEEKSKGNFNKDLAFQRKRVGDFEKQVSEILSKKSE